MSEWKRTTREVTFDQFPADLKTEIQKHIEFYNLGDILSDALICVQTTSEKTRKGLFGSAEIVHQGVVLTPRWLLWAVSGTKAAPAALSALLTDIIVRDFARTQFAKLAPDSGIEVTGKLTDVAENGSAFIGLEDNLTGRKFTQAAIDAVQSAKK